MLREHWDELALDKERIPLDPRWDRYDAIDAAGALLLIMARADGIPVGYFVGFLAAHMHYAGCLCLSCDLFYIRADHRRGHAGVRLFRAMEDEARRLGVQRVVVATKLHRPADALLRFMKFRPIETNYSKYIGAA